MSFILYLFVAILILMFLITIHELGHYLAGKALGFRITEFSIGFGKAIYKRQSKKTGEIFAIRMIPLGGYCAFAGGDEADGAFTGNKDCETETCNDDGSPKFPDAKGQNYNDTKTWKRLIVLFSGAFFNFVSAIFFCMILIGAFGYFNGIAVAGLNDNSHNTYLRENDVIIGIRLDDTDHRFTMLNNANTVISNIGIPQDGRAVIFIIQRENNYGVIAEDRVPGSIVRVPSGTTVNTEKFELPHLGIYAGNGGHFVWQNAGFFESIGRGFVLTFEFAWMILNGFWQLITGQLNLAGNVAGPIGTTTMMVQMMDTTGAFGFLMLLPVISVSLAVFNLLPIPALDGARMVFTGIEWARGKPINPELEGKIHMFGLLGLFAFAILADILFLPRFLSGSVLEILSTISRWRL